MSGFQGIMKNRVLEDIQKIPAKIQGGQLGHGQGHGDAFPGFQHKPQAFAALFFIVDGKSRSLEGNKIPVNRPDLSHPCVIKKIRIRQQFNGGNHG